MRHIAVCAVVLTHLAGPAGAEPIAIDQSAWLNYAIVVHADGRASDVRLGQSGAINAISSAQLAGERDAWLWIDQRGRRNDAFAYQAGWDTISRIVQRGPDGLGAERNLPTRYVGPEIDDTYLSYFMSGGFSLVTLTDTNHTWISRFGRAR